jgi:hypothetical protein
VARSVAAQLQTAQGPGDIVRAFLKNTRAWMSIFRSTPVGWGRVGRKRVAKAHHAADRFIQKLNDRYADPSGASGRAMETAEKNEVPAQEQPARVASGGS